MASPQTVILQPGQSITITAASAPSVPPVTPPPVTPPPVTPPPVTPPPTTPPVTPPASRTWNMPQGMKVVCQTGVITAASAGLANVSGKPTAGPAINFGGPVGVNWTRNGGNGAIGLSAAATNPDGSTNTDPQFSGVRFLFPAGQTNDPAVNLYFDHAGSTGSYYVGWLQRQKAWGSYAALKSAMNSQDSKVLSPKGAGDLTIMSWMDGGNQNPVVPVIGLNFQGSDGHNIPDVNHSGGAGTIPVTSAMTLPGVNAGGGQWDQMEVLIQGTACTLYVNGKSVGTAVNVGGAPSWTATEIYLSRSVYSGVQAKLHWMDIDQLTIAVS